MTDVSHQWDFLESAWRLAFLLTGCREGADKIFREATAEVLKHPHADEAERAKSLLLAAVRRRSLKFPARCELEGAAASLHRLAEPGRSALALLYLNAATVPELQHVLQVEGWAVHEALEAARKALREQMTPAP